MRRHVLATWRVRVVAERAREIAANDSTPQPRRRFCVSFCSRARGASALGVSPRSLSHGGMLRFSLFSHFPLANNFFLLLPPPPSTAAAIIGDDSAVLRLIRK